MKSLSQPRRRTFGPLKAIEFQASAGSPTIVCLHGYGADAADLAPLAAELDLARPARWVFPDAPLPLAPEPLGRGRAWFAIDETELTRTQMEGARLDLSAAQPPGLDEAAASLEELIKSLELPWNGIILGGFSQGAMLAVESALRAPETPLGLFILSGTLVDEPALRRRAPARAGLKFFQSHGTRDPLLDYEGGKRLNEALGAAGLAGGLMSFDGGHGVPREVSEALEAYLNSVLGNGAGRPGL